MRTSTSNIPIHSDVYDLAVHTSGLTIGPMPVQLFLDKFLPNEAQIPKSKSRKGICSCIPTKRANNAFVKTMRSICPGFEPVPLISDLDVYDTSSPDPKTLPDFCLYSSGVDRNSPDPWPLMDMFIEWRVNAKRDAYRETFVANEKFDYDSDKAFKLRGHMFSFAARLMDSQHRLFVFAVDIYGDRARLYRFDPSSVVVSEPILFRKDSKPLDQFFLRYSSASPAERGHDPTIIPATVAEKVLFQKRVVEYLERAERNNLRTHPDVTMISNEVFRVQVNDADDEIHWYLACKSGKVPSDRSPCGRFTRGFIATPVLQDASASVHYKEGEDKPNLFWLKDSWRASSKESEISIYRKLKAKGIPNLPEIFYAGDICDGSILQSTLNDSVLSEGSHPWARPTKPIRHMIHHRIVSELLIPFTSVGTPRELLLVGRDVLTAIAAAFHEGHVYNCDISLGNVMMTERQGDHEGPWGVLNDWDHALWTNAEPTDRVGTWQFISIQLLQNIDKPHDIFDDIESLLWVLLFLAVRRFKHEGNFHIDIFDENSSHSEEVRGRVTTGGSGKKFWLELPELKFACEPLQAFFTSFRRFHRERYYHIARLSYGDGWDKPLQEFEEEIKKDIYSLVSHFDTVLNDPDADWTGEKTNEAPPDMRLPPPPPPPPPSNPPTQVAYHPDHEKDSEPSAQTSAPATSGTCRGKRKREESQVPDEPQAKHAAPSQDENNDSATPEITRPIPRAPRRRRPPPPPSDRVLRPRPWRK